MSAFTSALGHFHEVSTFHDAQYGRGRCVALLSGPSRLAVGYSDGRLQLFDPTESGPLELAADSFCVHALAASPDGALLACAGRDGVVMRQADGGQPVAGKQGEVKSLAFHPGGDVLAVGGMDGAVSFLSLRNEDVPGALSAHAQFVETLAFSPDGQWLATGGLDGVSLWNWRQGKRLHLLEVGGSCPKALAFTEEGRTLAVGSEDGVIRRFDVESGGPRGELPPEAEGAGVWTLALSPDGTVLAAGCEDGRIRLWGHGSSTLLRTLEGHEDAVLSVAWESDAVLVSAGRDGAVRLWSEQRPSWVLPAGPARSVDEEDGGEEEDGEEEAEDGGEEEGSEHLQLFEDHESGVTALALHPQGALLVSADVNGHIKLRDLSGVEEEAADLHAHEGMVTCVGFSPDGALLVTTSAAGGVRVFEIADGAERGHGEHPGGVTALAFHPERAVLFTGGGSTVLFWDVRRGAQPRPLHEVVGEVTRLAVRPDGGLLAVASLAGDDATVQLVPLGGDEQERRWSLPGNRVSSLAFSPDGTRLALGLEGGQVQLWDVKAGAPVAVLCCKEEPVHYVAFTPGGEGLVAADADVLNIWRLEDEETLFSSEDHFGDQASVLFDADGDVLIASSVGSLVRLQVLPAGEEE